MTKELKRIHVLQAGLFLGAFYALIGLLIGVIYGLFIFLFGAAMGASAMPTASGGTGGPSASPGQVMALMGGLGILAAVVLPIAYGALGFVGGLIAAAFYNLIAKFAGGLKFDVEDIGHLPR